MVKWSDLTLSSSGREKNMPDLLQQAIASIQEGDEATGEKLLIQVLEADPNNESALLWMFKVADTYEERLKYVKQALKVNPNSRWAVRGLKILEMEATKPFPQSAAAGSAQPHLTTKPALITPPQPTQKKADKKTPSVLLTVPVDTPEADAARPAGMYDAFISYSRKDKPFVQKLFETLEANDYDAWVDWGNIPLTADWRQEIREGVERANAVIFVLSPDFLASKECRVELEIAESYSKRLIPVVYRDVDPNETPPSLAALNWIFARQTDDFDNAFQSLATALGTDLEWVKTHTRLLVKAIEWDNEKRNPSYLLRGVDLREAEQAVAQSDKNPSPTPLQKQYILASRQRAIRRQRFILIQMAVGFVISLALAILAYTLYLEAQRQTELAERKAQIALSRQLAAQSVAYSNDELDLALLLNLEAGRIAQTVEGSNEVNLLAGLSYSPILTKFLHGHTDLVTRIVFSPDGQTLASSSRDKTIILWDLRSGQPIGSPLTGHTDWIYSLAFSPDGQTLASGGHDNTIRLWDVATGKQLGEPLAGHTDQIWNLAFSPDGQTLASAGADKTIRLWDISTTLDTGIATGRPIGDPLVGHRDTPRALQFSPDGKTLFSGSADNMAFAWDAATGRMLGSPVAGNLEGLWWHLAFSPDGQTLASAGDDNRVVLWDASTGNQIGDPFIRHTAAVYNVVFSPNGKTLASAGDDKSVILWDTERGKPLGPPLTGHSGWISALAFSPDGQTLASGAADRTIILWDVGAEQFLTRHSNWVYSVAFSPDGQTLASGSYDRSVMFWDVAARQSAEFEAPADEQYFAHNGPVRTVAYSPNGQLLATGGEDKVVRLWNAATRQPAGEPLTGHKTKIKSVAFSPDGQTLASGSLDGEIILWNVTTRQKLAQLPARHTNELTSVAFHPDGRLLASASDDGTIIVWDVATRQPLGEPLAGHRDWVNSIAFSSDGDILASGSADTTLILWDVATRRPLGDPLKGHTNKIWSIAFSPDGKLLASGSEDNTIILWDVASRSPIGPPLTGHINLVRGLAFSPDGKTLASASADNTVILWNVELEDWPIRACRIANRNLTLKEWDTFIGPDHPYHLTCPNLPAPPAETTISAVK
jgi:WD40 repeat protein